MRMGGFKKRKLIRSWKRTYAFPTIREVILDFQKTQDGCTCPAHLFKKTTILPHLSDNSKSEKDLSMLRLHLWQVKIFLCYFAAIILYHSFCIISPLHNRNFGLCSPFHPKTPLAIGILLLVMHLRTAANGS